jgi:hypothetical protein
MAVDADNAIASAGGQALDVRGTQRGSRPSNHFAMAAIEPELATEFQLPQ